MSRPPTLLLVDDEEALLEGLRYSLGREGFTVEVARDGQEALEAARSLVPDLILLDVMLPGMDGLAVCRELRRRGFEAPVLLLTCKDEEIDKVVGLEVGADDYITKPFGTRELVARVRAHLRRWQRQTSASLSPAVLQAESLSLNTQRQEAHRDGRDLNLTRLEFQLLLHLMSNANRVLTREALLESIWGYDFEGDSNVLQAAVRRLRDKLEDNPAQPRFVVTVRGVGYRFEAPVRAC